MVVRYCKPLPKKVAVTQSPGNTWGWELWALLYTCTWGINLKHKNVTQQWLDSANKHHYRQHLSTAQITGTFYWPRFQARKGYSNKSQFSAAILSEQPTNNTATAPSCHNSELAQVAQVSLDTGALQQTGETIPQQQKLQVNSDPKFKSKIKILIFSSKSVLTTKILQIPFLYWDHSGQMHTAAFKIKCLWLLRPNTSLQKASLISNQTSSINTITLPDKFKNKENH